MRAQDLQELLARKDQEEQLYACPPHPSAKDAELVLMPLARCFERLKFASETKNEFKNGCYRCQTGMIRFAEEMMK